MIFHYLYYLCSVYLKGGFIYYNCVRLFLAVLGLHCCMGFSLVAVSRGYSRFSMCGLISVVSFVEQGL